jgi:AraC-like DNA-binding protein
LYETEGALQFGGQVKWSGMEHARLWQSRPHGPLSEFVDCIWIHEGYGGAHARERVLPTATVDLVLSFDSERGAAATVAGPRSECLELDTSHPFSACGVHFKPGGARPFIAEPADLMRNQIVDLDSVWGPLGRTVEAQVWEARTPAQRLRIIEETLRLRMSPDRVGHPAVSYAVRAIERSRGAEPIGEIAGRIGLSTRRFLDLFQSEVGLAPKAFSRMRRFAAALDAIAAADDVDWADLALSCGYFDQAHFNHDFRAFCGVSPSEYLRARASRTHVIVST